jgi:hypothetical protein
VHHYHSNSDKASQDKRLVVNNQESAWEGLSTKKRLATTDAIFSDTHVNSSENISPKEGGLLYDHERIF